MSVRVELRLGQTWTDVTDRVYNRDRVRISRGRTSEGARADASSCSLTLDNRDGRFSPRNPTGPYYGLIGRNTPMRVSYVGGANRLVVRDAGSYFATELADHSGDLDLRLDVTPPTWRPASASWLGLVRTSVYGLLLRPTGQLELRTSPDGTSARSWTSTEALHGSSSGRKVVRATLALASGTATFYTGTSLDGPWYQVGAPVVTGATGLDPGTGQTLKTLISSGTTGIVVHGLRVDRYADVDFGSTGPGGLTEVTGGEGETWQRVGTTAQLDDVHTRFAGEVAEWPQRWDPTGADVWAPVVASGILRRLGQGAPAVTSPIRRGIASGTSVVAYWPLEDGPGARTALQAVGTRPATVSGPVVMATNGAFACSSPLPELHAGQIVAPLPAYAHTGEAQVRLLLDMPTGNLEGTVLARIRTSGTLGWADLKIGASNSWYLELWSHLGVLGHTTASTTTGLAGTAARLSVQLKQDGATVAITLATLRAGASSGTVLNDTKAGLTLGAVTRIEINPNSADLGQMGLGHLSVESRTSSIFDVAQQLNAYAGERADVRIARLCEEAGVPVFTIGSGAGCERMGQQEPGDLVELLRECETTDAGILHEDRGALGLRYRSLESMWSQDPALSLPYDGGWISGLEPVDDDSATRNAVTVTRRGGGSATVEETSGPMSVQAPPNGVGRYESTATVSLASDLAARHHAGWAVAQGTVDEARWPALQLELEHPDASGAEVRDALLLDVGDVVEVTDLPAWIPPGPIRGVVQGATEEYGTHSALLRLNLAPASPYRVGAWTASATRIDADPVVQVQDDGTGDDGDPWDPARWSVSTTLSDGSATYQGEGLRMATGTAGGYAGTERMSANAVTSALTDCEISGLVLLDTNEPYPLAVVRGTRSSVDFTDGYLLTLDGNGQVGIFRVVAYAPTLLAGASRTLVAGTTYGFRLQAVGTSIRARVWTGSEPDSWDLVAVDSTITSGVCGVSVGAGNAAVAHVVTWDEMVVAVPSSGSVVTSDPGPDVTRWGTDGSSLSAALEVGATSMATTTVGPSWTTNAADLPLDVTVGGERMRVTAVSGTGAAQTLTVTRALEGITRTHAAGSVVRLAEPALWGARPAGDSTWYTSGGSGGGSTTTPDPGTSSTPNTVQIGSTTYALSGQDPDVTSGWGGDAAYPGARGVDQLVTYSVTSPTPTNQWGVEVSVDSAGLVTAVNDREVSQSTTGTAVPSGGYVLSGNGAAAAWLRANATVGAEVLILYVAPTGGTSGTGGSTTGGSTTTGTYPAVSVAVYKMIYSNSQPSVSSIPSGVNEIRMSFAFGTTIATPGWGAEGQASFLAGIAAKRAAGCRITISLGGAGNTVGLTQANFMAGLANIYNSWNGNLDGIDWDIEAHGFTTAQIRDISVACKATYGSGFSVTFAPTGSKVAEYLAAAKACQDAGALDNYGQQFYDAPVSLAAAKGRITEAINYGIPVGKISVGMMIGSDANHWTNAQCRSYMADIRASYPGLTKAYLWEAGLSGTAQWVTDMRSVLG